jgi:glycerol-1-phosphate dehydrogenase [NAD(P)+]
VNTPRQIRIPSLLRIKPGALDRIGLYARRLDLTHTVALVSADLPTPITRAFDSSLAAHDIQVLAHHAVPDASFEQATHLFSHLPPTTRAILGLGGGKALDTAKYVAFLARLPYIAIPTSLSNDGFCSPQSSLTLDAKRRSLPSAMPFGVVIDTTITHAAPNVLWLSGIGDLISKITAVNDWKRAFHARGTPVDDFAALLSDATVFQFMGRPVRDPAGEALLAHALLLNGIAMEVCGSSRPASGSEHLISHALDAISPQPRLHGLQVGVATYIVSHLQNQGTDRIRHLFEQTRFHEAFTGQPLRRSEWIEATRLAPSIKQNFHTVLSEADPVPAVTRLLHEDPFLTSIFTD